MEMEDSTSRKMVREAKTWLDPEPGDPEPGAPKPGAPDRFAANRVAANPRRPVEHPDGGRVPASGGAPFDASVGGFEQTNTRSAGTRFVLFVALVGLVAAGAAVFRFVSSPDLAPITSIEAGTCFLEPDGASVGEVEVVDCAAQHDLEAFAIVRLPFGSTGALPDDDTLYGSAYEECLVHFEAYTGESYSTSAWWLDAFVPDRHSWKAGDREAVCVLYLADEAGYPITAQRSARR